MTAPGQARQGHRYRWYGWDVLALQSGEGMVRVADLVPDWPWLGEVRRVPAAELIPQPMRYFHGEIPQPRVWVEDAKYLAWCKADERRMLGRASEPGDAELLARPQK